MYLQLRGASRRVLVFSTSSIEECIVNCLSAGNEQNLVFWSFD